MKNLKTFSLTFLCIIAITINYAQTTFKLPIPSQTEALAKVKSSESLKERLSEIGLTQADIQISLKEHEAYIPQSDEICYQIYRDSKKIEGSNYIYMYIQ
ncbi:MAG: hypothetical protein ACK46Y_12040 [Fluviicola sp.]|jgi:hypothetical protein